MLCTLYRHVNRSPGNYTAIPPGSLYWDMGRYSFVFYTTFWKHLPPLYEGFFNFYFGGLARKSYEQERVLTSSCLFFGGNNSREKINVEMVMLGIFSTLYQY